MGKFLNSLDIIWLDMPDIEIRHLDDGKSYALLNSDLQYLTNSGVIITIPKGFLTDFASVPRIFWSIFPFYDPYYGKPAVLHDYLLSVKGIVPNTDLKLTKKDIDKLFKEAMINQGTEKWRYNIMYWAVRVFGGKF